MKNIAILSCLKSNRVCAGVACLKAFNERRAAFAGYQDEPLTLTAFLRCTQCGVDPEQDPGMMEKLERIVSCKTQVAHIGKCCQNKDGTPCPHMQKAADYLSGHGVKVVWGTH
ncbi:MAG TPA: CGGC domain-containing protein [Candidatus Faecaligallichristensenella faecipullorum]|nr:CGGC domain-containing protein [Candidatus Faecaligallichristensenella faecipullorum]